MGRARGLVRRPSMVGSSGDVSMRVLAFEDSYNIEKILLKVELISVIVNFCNIGTQWIASKGLTTSTRLTSSDHYIPPVKGLEVLRGLLELVSSDKIQRPKLILGISSSSVQMMRWNQRGQMVP